MIPIDDRVDQLREELLALGVDMTPPIDPLAIARALGIGVRQVSEPQALYDGALLESADGRFTILINPRAGGTARQRFTLAHEIVHTLVPADPSHLRLRTPERRRRPDAALERLIDRGAARLLMPPDTFGDDLAACGLTPEGLLSLAHRYGVSREAAAVQAVVHWPQPTAVVFCDLMRRPSTDPAAPLLREQPRWRVSRGFAGESFPVYPHPGLALADGGAVERAALTGREVSKDEVFGDVRVRMTARPLSARVVPPPRVLGVAIIDPLAR